MTHFDELSYPQVGRQTHARIMAPWPIAADDGHTQGPTTSYTSWEFPHNKGEAKQSMRPPEDCFLEPAEENMATASLLCTSATLQEKDHEAAQLDFPLLNQVSMLSSLTAQLLHRG